MSIVVFGGQRPEILQVEPVRRAMRASVGLRARFLHRALASERRGEQNWPHSKPPAPNRRVPRSICDARRESQFAESCQTPRRPI